MKFLILRVNKSMEDTLIKIKEIKTVKGKKNILICGSGFVMKNPYKDTSIYSEGVLKQLEFLDSYDGNFTYRFYFDDSLAKDKNWKVTLKELKKRSYTELFKYQCDIIKEGDYHDGVFGTFMRFLPLFDKKVWNMVSVIDIDSKIDKHFFMELDKFDGSKANFFIKLPKCYHLKPWLNKLELVRKNSLAIIASGFSSKITFNKKILLNFLIDVIERGNHYQRFLEVNDFNSPAWEKNKEKDTFIYGLDEYFLSDIILRELKEVLIYNWYIHYTGLLIQIKKINDDFKNLSEEEKNRWINLLKNVLRKAYDPKKSLNRNYSKLQYLTYCHENGFNMMICRNLAREIRKIFDKKKQHLYKIPNYMKQCFYLKNYDTYYTMKLKK